MFDPKEIVGEYNENALLLPGHDNAIIGVGLRCGQLSLAVYDNSIVRTNLIAEGMDETDAIEFFEFNILGGWHGENTPIFMEPCEGIMDTIHRLKEENRLLRQRIADEH